MIEIRADGCMVKVLGYQHENDRAQIRFPLDDVRDMMYGSPGGAFTLAYRRPFDGQFYVSEDIEVDGDYLIWTVGSHALAVRGDVAVQITYSTADQIAKTQIFRFKVSQSIDIGEAGQGENLADLIEQALIAAGSVHQEIAAAEETLDAAVQAAQDAQAAAETAQGKAETAQRKAETAKTTATMSANAAYNAAADANTAKRDAVNAKTDAVQAKGGAELAQRAAEDAKDSANTYALKSEGYAVGTQDGVPAGEGEPYYHDNAKYYKESAEAAKDDAVAAKDRAEQVVSGIEAAGDAQVQRVNAAGSTQTGNVNTAGTTQTQAVNTAGAAQVAAVQAKGTEVLNSIPADYTQMTEDVGSLKSAIDNLDDNLGIVNFSGFKHGVAASLNPDSNDMYKYVIVDKTEIPSSLYIRTTTQYNVFYKVVSFSSNGSIVAAMANWTLIENNGEIDLRTVLNYPSSVYAGFSFCYSTTTSKDDAIAYVPLDDLYITNSNYVVAERVVNDSEKLIDLSSAVGSDIVSDFIYGNLTDSIVPTQTNERSKKCILIDLDNVDDNLKIFNTTSYYLLLWISIYDSTGTRLLTNGGYIKFDNGTVVAREEFPTLPTAKYVGLTFKLSTTTAESGSISVIPNTNDVYLSKYDKTIVQRLNRLEGIGKTYNAIVDINGNGDYTSINSAINGTSNGDIILIMPGQYNEDVQMFGKNRVLVGLDREHCIIYNGSGLYDTPPLEANIGGVKNLTIISGNDDDLTEDSTIRKAYGVHIEYANSSAYQIVFENCTIISELHAAVGIGCRYNQTVIFRDCLLQTKASQTYSTASNSFIDSAGLLFHNDTTGATGNGVLHLDNCEIVGKTKAVMCQNIENNSEMTVRFNKCLAYIANNGTTDIVGFWNNSEKGVSPYFCGTNIKLDSMSYGNNSPELDFANYWN